MNLTRLLRILSYLFCLLVLPSGYAFGYALLDHTPGSPADQVETNRKPASFGDDIFFDNDNDDRPRRFALSSGREVIVFNREQIHSMARTRLGIDSGMLISLTSDQVLTLTESGKRDARIAKANQYCRDYGMSLRPQMSGRSHGTSFSVSMDGYDQAELFDKIGCLLSEPGDSRVVESGTDLERDLASGESYYDGDYNIQ